MALGVYISYPFCSQKCTFCNFASGVHPRGTETDYLESLRTEIARNVWDRTPDTVYLGGGTPSQMPPDGLASLLELIPGRPWVEATIEAAPGTVTFEKAAAWKQAGIDRVSLGVQSFSTPELARTGRKHTAQVVAAEVEVLRAAGLSNFNIDLIAGLPGQTQASWQLSLDWIAALNPPHVSVYMFEVDEDSRLGQEVLLNGNRYGAPDVPADEHVARFYETAVLHLAGLGIARYEISNFAKPGWDSAHNLKYWRLDPYIGFGADAHSFDGRTRRQNVEAAADYIEHMRRLGSAVAESTAAQPSDEKFYVGLRLSEGVKPDELEWRKWNPAFQRFMDEGLLEQRAGRIRLTDRGIMYSNEVFAEFVA